MRYLSLFSGVGGFELGIERAYERMCIKNKKQQVQGIRNTQGQPSERTNLCTDGLTCIGFSEIDKYAIKVYQHHFPNHKNYGDITKIDETSLPDFDLLVGGFPCQSFSIAGKRGGFNDTRGTLFFEIAGIVREKQPRLLLLENVKGLLSHDKGRTFFTIITTLDELGYDCQWQVLNAKDFGVPQNRERVFIVGHLRGTPRPKVFPFGGTTNQVGQKYAGSYGTPRKGVEHQNHLSRAHKQPTRAYYTDGIAPTLSAQELSGRNNIVQLNNPTHSNDRVYGTDGVSPTLNTMQGGRRQPFITDPQGRKNKVCNPKPYASTLRANTHGNEQVVNAIRRLTPLECERLMGFPDNWTNVDGMSDTQRYKQCGNGVVTNVVQAIMERLLSTINTNAC